LLQARSHPADVDCSADRRPRFTPRSGPLAANVFRALSPPARVAVHSRPRGWSSNAIRLIEPNGTDLWGRSGSVITPLAHSGDRYADSYFCDEWVKTQELDASAPAAALAAFEGSGH
jgi:hypothetical protein